MTLMTFIALWIACSVLVYGRLFANLERHCPLLHYEALNRAVLPISWQDPDWAAHQTAAIKTQRREIVTLCATIALIGPIGAGVAALVTGLDRHTPVIRFRFLPDPQAVDTYLPIYEAKLRTRR